MLLGHIMENSLYAMYMKEKFDFEVIEQENGFINFRFNEDGKGCFIRDVYVKPAHRGTDLVDKLEDAVIVAAKERGCKYLSGQVMPGTKGVERATMAMLKRKWKIVASDNEKVILVKEL